MNKSGFIKRLSESAKIPEKDSAVVVETMFDSLSFALKGGGRAEIRGFGSFSLHERDGYLGRNPATGEDVVVPPKRVPFFKAGKTLHARMNKKVTENE